MTNRSAAEKAAREIALHFKDEGVSCNEGWILLMADNIERACGQDGELQKLRLAHHLLHDHLDMTKAGSCPVCELVSGGKLRYFPTPFEFREPKDDSTAPRIFDAKGSLVASLFWPTHPGEETEAAERETYRLGRAMAAAAERSCGETAWVDLLKRFVEATVSSHSSEQLAAKIIPLAVDAHRLLAALPSPPTGRTEEKYMCGTEEDFYSLPECPACDGTGKILPEKGICDNHHWRTFPHKKATTCVNWRLEAPVNPLDKTQR